MSYCHLTKDDRTVIATLRTESRTQSYIARRVGVDKATIRRELARHAGKARPALQPLPPRPVLLDTDCRHARGSGLAQEKYQVTFQYARAIRETRAANRDYDAAAAQTQAAARRTRANQQRRRLVYGSHSWLEGYVRSRLLREQWSPEQIAGRLRQQYQPTLHWQAIYDYITRCPDRGDKRRLSKNLRHGGRPYRHHGTRARVNARQDALPSIDDRPAIANARARLGDTEGDTIAGLDTKDRLPTHVDRASGECMIGRIVGFTARNVADHTLRRIRCSPVPIHTITYDRGTEFADYERLERRGRVRVYFATAYHSWERGSNENLNGLVWQYFPKRTDFKTITARLVKRVETKLNTRPRKRYNYRTPIEQRQYLQRCQKLGNVALRERM